MHALQASWVSHASQALHFSWSRPPSKGQDIDLQTRSCLPCPVTVSCTRYVVDWSPSWASPTQVADHLTTWVSDAHGDDQSSYNFTMTVHKLSVALWSSSLIASEDLCAVQALYHVSGIKYFNFLSEFTTQNPSFISSLLADSSNCRNVIPHGLTSDARSTQLSSQNIHISS